MSDKELFETFAQNFVRPEFRDRFVHEALKKPGKLHSRICHSIGDLFDAKFAHGTCSFGDAENCVMISGSKGFKTATWSDARNLIGFDIGLLVIGADGRKFYAETEASRGDPSVKYAAGS